MIGFYCCNLTSSVVFMNDAQRTKKPTKSNKRLSRSGVIHNKFDENDIAILPLLKVSCQTFISSQYRHACMIGSGKDLMLHFCQHWPALSSWQATPV